MSGRDAHTDPAARGMAASFLLASVITILAPATGHPHSGDAIALEFFGTESSSEWLIRTNFGVITSDSPTEYVCEEAFLGTDFFLVAPISTVYWATFGETSVHVTRDGCSFDKVMELDEAPVDADAHPASGRFVFVTNSDRDAGLWWSDDGASFVRIATDPDEIRLTGVGFVGPNIVLATSYANDSSRRATIHQFRLEDATREDLPVETDDLSFPYLLATSPNEFLWLARRQLPDTDPPEYERIVYWGETEDPKRWSTTTSSWPTGALFFSNDDKVAIAGINEGRDYIVGSRDEDQVVWVSRRSQTATSCIGRSAEQLFACALRSVDGADIVALGTDPAEALIDFRDLEGPKSGCDSDTQTSIVCPLVWPDLAQALQVSTTDDMGMTASDDLRTIPPAPTGPEEGCGACTTTSQNRKGGALFFLLIGAVAWRCHASRRRERRDSSKQA